MRSSIRTYLLLLVACGVLQLAALETVLVGAEIRIVRDVAYRPDAETDYERTRCKLDLYLPAETKDAPSILWFHGGSLRFGDKGGAIEQGIGKHFAEEGIIFISANYRLHPQVSYPAYVEDAAAAFAFLHGTIETYGGSPRRIFISGHSAGGYLVAMVGLDPQFLAKSKLSPSDIAGVIPVTGQMLTHSTVRKEQEIPETRPVIDAASPCWHVRRDAPPFLNLAGSEDFGFEVIHDLKLGKKVRINNSFNFFQTRNNSSNIDDNLNVNTSGWMGKSRITWFMPKDYQLQASGRYRASMQTLQGSMRNNYTIDLVLKKNILKN
ncbi:MAG: alpha/beta hydrolase fold domain-containing protein, partial [Planctomycetaceae bacterium]|nr:alpha/beta hydrolase fold domain-containing protein [Planctomycetaceae bacterium]